jgi:ubiquinone biosynthesis protein COQ9
MTSEKDRLIEAALQHVIFDGMSDRAVEQGARDIGMTAALARVHLPRGGVDLAAAYHRRGDAALRADLAANPPQGRFRDRVVEAVMRRLALSDREMARAGAVVFALPQNAALGARLVWESADAIWEGLGDESRDVNWYSKRATLATVYGATVLYWLGDGSPEAEETRAFLTRRVEGVMRFEKFKGRMAALPGVSSLAGLATGWIRRPEARRAPGYAAGQPAAAMDKGDA